MCVHVCVCVWSVPAPRCERVSWALWCRICMSWLKWSKCRFGFYTCEQRRQHSALRPFKSDVEPEPLLEVRHHQGWEERSAGKEITLRSSSNPLPRYGNQGFIWRQGDVANVWMWGSAPFPHPPLSLAQAKVHQVCSLFMGERSANKLRLAGNHKMEKIEGIFLRLAPVSGSSLGNYAQQSRLEGPAFTFLCFF